MIELLEALHLAIQLFNHSTIQSLNNSIIYETSYHILHSFPVFGEL